MGIGQIGAISLLHLFLKYPEVNQRQTTSIQSGYRISKSEAKTYRGSLFMALMSAVLHDKNFKAFYERLKSKGSIQPRLRLR